MGNKESVQASSDTSSPKSDNTTSKTPVNRKSKERTFIEPENGNKQETKKSTSKANPKTHKDKAKVDAKTRLAFEDWLYKRLTQYFIDIQQNIIETRYDKNERNDIESAVNVFLGFLFTETEVVDRRFRVTPKDIISVGAFHENLEIIDIDKLDYLIIIDELSGKNIESLERLTEEGDEVLRVNLTENCSKRWDDSIQSEGLDKYWLLAEKGVLSTFQDKIIKAVDIVKSKSRGTIYRKHGRFDLVAENFIKRDKTSVEIKFTWKIDTIMRISLTPCLKYEDVNKFANKSTTPDQRVIKIIQSDWKLLLQPIHETKDRFRWQFGHVEKEFMKEKSLRTHKAVYQLIKFFVQGCNQGVIEEAEMFTEHVIKTMVLFHHSNCRSENRLADCVMALIDDMRKLLKEFRGKKSLLIVQSYIYRSQNVLPMCCRHANESVLHMNLAALEHLANHLINEIGCTPLYDFNNDIKTLIPLNAFVLREDYKARKNGDTKMKDSLEANKILIDAVGNKKFAVRF